MPLIKQSDPAGSVPHCRCNHLDDVSPLLGFNQCATHKAKNEDQDFESSFLANMDMLLVGILIIYLPVIG